jgi:hypothetical protein
LIPGLLTITAGSVCKVKIGKPVSNSCQLILTILPVLILIITPIFMYIQMKEQWLSNGRLSVLIIYSLLSLIQLFLAQKIIKLNKG